MTATSFLESHVDAVDPVEVGNGIVVRCLYHAEVGGTDRRAFVTSFPPGSRWPGADVHEPGPEAVFVVSGTFHGLAGDGSMHGPGSFIHCAAGSSHTPWTETGGDLFVYYPDG